MRPSKSRGWFVVFGAAIAVLAVPVFGAQSGTVPQDEWRFELTPYIFAAGLDGTVGVRGITADVDAGFSDLADHVDSAFMIAFEACKGPWMIGLDGMYFKLGDERATSVSGPFGRVTVDGTVDVTVTEQVYTLMGGYRVLDNETKLDLIGALRYTRIDNDLDLVITTTAVAFPGGAASISGDESWLDAVVGARVLWPFATHWTFMGYVDVGGSGSDSTYQAIAGVNWRFSPGFDAKVGYRYLYQDFKDNGTVWDMATSGMYLGLGIQWPK